jgi:hypothetical protein
MFAVRNNGQIKTTIMNHSRTQTYHLSSYYIVVFVELQALRRSDPPSKVSYKCRFYLFIYLFICSLFNDSFSVI